MTKEQFLEKITDLLDTEEKITMDSLLNDIEEWDSFDILPITLELF